MKDIHVQAQRDHIFSLCSSAAIPALTELIWNALDADAYDVKVDIIQNSLGAIDAVRVSDNGSGINIEEIERNFGNLGGSWKRRTSRTPEAGRVLHGCKGRGRFKAFALGNYVEWRTTVDTAAGLRSYTISGEAADPSRFTMRTQEQTGVATGTEVMILNPRNTLSALRDTTSALQQLSAYFALYLKAYPNVKIYFQGLLVNPVIVQSSRHSYSLKSSTGETAQLEIIEWKTKKTRAEIIFCNLQGFALHSVGAGIRPGSEFNFTAYLISPLFEELNTENLLIVEELHPKISAFLDAARETLRAYFRSIREQKEHDIRYQWIEENFYPFEPDSADKLRPLFDNCAQALQTYSNNFEELTVPEKRLVFALLKESLAASPQATIKMLCDNLKVSASTKKRINNT